MRWLIASLLFGLVACSIQLQIDERLQKTDSVAAAFKDCRDCPAMRVIPTGQFVMGSPESEGGRQLNSGGEGGGLGDKDRELQHGVIIDKSFALGVFPITKGQYAQFVQAAGYDPVNECFSSNKAGPGGFASVKFDWQHPGFYTQQNDEPVQCISALDALAYIDWLSKKTGKTYRLPSEAEWEYAARAGTTTSRYWGDDAAQGCAYANGIGSEASATFDGTPTGCDDHYLFTSPVGAYLPNAFGLYDMLGNTWQWTADCWHANYVDAPTNGAAWGQEPHCKRSVLRGGSFVSNHTSLRSAARHEAWPSSRIFNYGFRVARDL